MSTDQTTPTLQDLEIIGAVVLSLEMPHIERILNVSERDFNDSLNQVFDKYHVENRRDLVRVILEKHAETRAIIDYGFTRRELEVIVAVGEAKTNRRIAADFGISEYTVKHHLTRIFDKVGVGSRIELANFARTHGLKMPPLISSPPPSIVTETSSNS